MRPSWLNKRTVAATCIIAWAGALHMHMLSVQRQIGAAAESNNNPNQQQQQDSGRGDKVVTIKLSTGSED